MTKPWLLPPRGPSPLHPQTALRLQLGAGYYYSTQERILFERLLSQGHKPDLAIFVDGLNDLWFPRDSPCFSQVAAAAFGKDPTYLVLRTLSISRIFRKVQKETLTLKPIEAQEQVRPILQRYQSNVKLIESACRAFGTTAVFVWQPVPSYKYDTKYHLFYLSPKSYQSQAYGYPEMERLYKNGAFGPDFLWCADLQQDEKECLYVDGHHYTAKFSKKLAEAISQMCLQRKILQRAGLESEPAHN